MDAGTANAPALTRRGAVWLGLILVIAAVLRLVGLDRPGYSFDECWKSETAAGRGSAHLRLPAGVPFRAVDVYDPRPAPPWWQVWTHVECTHPPLYFVQLRLWTAAFGRSDAAERSCAAVTSLAAIALLFDAVRLTSSTAVAGPAALLMAVAAPQVEQARLTSNYALELVAVLAAADALVRLDVLGPNRRRFVGLGVGVLTAALSHYFAAGALGGLAAFVAVRLSGPARRGAAVAFAAAAAIYLACWGPFMWQQRHLFATDDPATLFLADAGPGHAGRVVAATAAIPGRMFGRLTGRLSVGGWVLVPLYALPFPLVKRRPELLVWGLLLAGSVGLIAAMDLTRQTRQVTFSRYVILAGPPTYATLAMLAAALPGPWLPRVGTAAAVAVAVALAGQAYTSDVIDPRDIAAKLHDARPDDLVVLLGRGATSWTANTAYLLLSRYARPFPAPVAIEHGPPGAAVLARAGRSRRTFVFSVGADPRPLFPNLDPVGPLTVSGQQLAWVFHPRPPGPMGSR